MRTCRAYKQRGDGCAALSSAVELLAVEEAGRRAISVEGLDAVGEPIDVLLPVVQDFVCHASRARVCVMASMRVVYPARFVAAHTHTRPWPC
jgi:hypothetical protein